MYVAGANSWARVYDSEEKKLGLKIFRGRRFFF